MSEIKIIVKKMYWKMAYVSALNYVRLYNDSIIENDISWERLNFFL